MKKLKIHIHFPFTNGPAGGGNNFLQGLVNEYKNLKVYAEDPTNADIILFNSHHDPAGIIQLKLKYPNKYFIHRIDGPMALYNKTSDNRDIIVKLLCEGIADAIIFQSHWSKEQNQLLKSCLHKPHQVILNAANSAFFYPRSQHVRLPFNSRKTKLVSTGFSTNPNKGIEFLDWLDKNLDFRKFDYTFIGTPPCPFQNIKINPPMAPPQLADLLCEHDIFIFTSKFEACSNALVEALSCHIPSIIYGASSNIELVPDVRLHFKQAHQIPAIVDLVIENYEQIRESIHIMNRQEIALSYLDFASSIVQPSGPKPIPRMAIEKLKIRLFHEKIKHKFLNLVS